MRVFQETQKFSKWWIILPASILILGLLMLSWFSDNSNSGIEFSIAIVLTLLIFLFLYQVELYTRIGPEGISVKFLPFGIFKKSYNWNEIRECFTRKYSPVREYGGWGIRISRKGKAYNMKGYQGIQIITKKGNNFLIGTQKPQQAEAVIDRYLTKNKT